MVSRETVVNDHDPYVKITTALHKEQKYHALSNIFMYSQDSLSSFLSLLLITLVTMLIEFIYNWH